MKLKFGLQVEQTLHRIPYGRQFSWDANFCGFRGSNANHKNSLKISIDPQK